MIQKDQRLNQEGGWRQSRRVAVESERGVILAGNTVAGLVFAVGCR